MGVNALLSARLRTCECTLRGAGAGRPRCAASARVALAALACATLGSARAQQAPVPGADPPRTSLDASRMELRGLERDLSSSEAQRRKGEADVETLRTERVRLSAALIEATNGVQGAEAGVAEVEARLQTLVGSEDAIRRSLDSRRAVIAEVLGALQRMGRKPPPAVLVSPADMLMAIRTSMLLGTVIPGLRSEAEIVAADLSEAARLRESIAADRDRLSQRTAALGAEQKRLAALIEARRDDQTQAEGELAAERQHVADLARQATSLKDLIGRLETEVAPSRRAADAARAAEDARKQADAEGVRAKASAPTLRDPARLAPAVAFADAKGQLPFPASGAIVKNYGASDGLGSAERGVSLATRPQAVVSAPADGWISYAGPYRSYGQLLIMNTGGGYYIVLAGMGRINVAAGQFVLAGEPVGTMGDGSVRTAASIALGAAQPILYVEFRKDGTAVDPGPWWAKAEVEKVRG